MFDFIAQDEFSHDQDDEQLPVYHCSEHNIVWHSDINMFTASVSDMGWISDIPDAFKLYYEKQGGITYTFRLNDEVRNGEGEISYWQYVCKPDSHIAIELLVKNF